jgi:hypothetical protein
MVRAASAQREARRDPRTMWLHCSSHSRQMSAHCVIKSSLENRSQASAHAEQASAQASQTSREKGPQRETMRAAAAHRSAQSWQVASVF